MMIPLDPENSFESMKTVLNTACDCGHKVYQHANVWSGYEEFQYITVSQCVMCDCKEFEMEKIHGNLCCDG